MEDENRQKEGSRVVRIIRWIGVVILPITVSMIADYMMVSAIGTYRLLIEWEGKWWSEIILTAIGIISGMVMVVCAYVVAPRAKMKTVKIYEKIYMILAGAGITLAYITGGVGIMEMVKNAALAIGVIIMATYYEKREEAKTG